MLSVTGGTTTRELSKYPVLLLPHASPRLPFALAGNLAMPKSKYTPASERVTDVRFLSVVPVATFDLVPEPPSADADTSLFPFDVTDPFTSMGAFTLTVLSS